MRTLLLVGASGQLGREIETRAKHAGFPVHGLTRSTLDIADRKTVLDVVGAIEPSVVVNAAAYNAVDQAESDAVAAFRTNRDGPAHLADACAAERIPLVHISTDYVFDGQKPTAYSENDAPAPINVYGASKLAGEEAVRTRCPRHVILRTSWLYSVHGNNFLGTILRLAQEHDSLRVVCDQIGCPTSVGDLADAVLTIVARLLSPTNADELYGTFHCAGSGTTSRHGFAEKIIAFASPITGRRPAIEAIQTADYPAPARRPANSALDCRKLLEIHGIALRSWESALRDTVNEALAVAASAKTA